MRLIDFFWVTFKGVHLGILGQRASGKTTLQGYIRNGSLKIGEYRPTLTEAPQRWNRMHVKQSEDSEGNIRTVQMKIRAGTDIPGDSDKNGEAWRRQVLSNTHLLYLFDAHELNKTSEYADQVGYGRQMETDCELISAYLQDHPRTATIAFVGTHCDLDQSYFPPGTPRFLDYYAMLYSNASLQRCRALLGEHCGISPPVILGSFSTPESAQDLCSRAWTQGLELK